MRTATVILSLGYWTLCSLGCFIENNGLVTPVHVPFERVFALEDTIRLDPSVLIGSVRALDVDDKGQLLLVDGKNRSVQLFSKTGEHRHAMRVEECDPGTSFDPETARFIEYGQVVVRSGFAAGYVFSSSGNCVAVERSEHVRTAIGFCADRDTVFAFPSLSPDQAVVWALSTDLRLVDEMSVPLPQWPRLAASLTPAGGRTIGCFDDGPWYIWPGSADAVSLRKSSNAVTYEPEFFRKRSRDVGRGDLVETIMESTFAEKLLELNEKTHMVVYAGSQKVRKGELGTGVMIVDHTAKGTGVSTRLPFSPIAAGYNFVYAVGDSEDRLDGYMGNPVIVRYRFILPQDIGD